MEQLAINGGESVVPPGMIKPWPHVTDEDRQAVLEVLSGESMLSSRRKTMASLARDWAEYVGVEYCIPTNSGTSALHMCVAALEIGPGDEVLIPAFTFWASAAAVLHHNAIPVFVDIDPRTFCIDPTRIEEKISDRTKAIMVVHIHGLPADMNAVLAIAKRHGLAVIEDAAQAHGARYDGRRCGSFGEVNGFSAEMSKVLTTGSEGGLFVTDDPVYYRRASQLQNFGEDLGPGTTRAARDYNALGLGWMYRGDVLGQAFLRSQLRRLDDNNAQRVRNCEFLTERLTDVPGVMTPYIPEGSECVYYNYVIGLDPEDLGLDMSPAELRDRVQLALNAEGVATGQWQTVPVPAQEIFRARRGYGDGCPWDCTTTRRTPSDVGYRAEDYPATLGFLDSHTYVFDIHPPNGLDLMELYVEAVKKVMANADQLPTPGSEGLNREVIAQRNP